MRREKCKKRGNWEVKKKRKKDLLIREVPQICLLLMHFYTSAQIYVSLIDYYFKGA